MNFLDGYFRTGDKMRSKRARQEFYCAVVEFYYKGVEPEFKTEAAEVGFEGIRYSLENSRKQRENARNPRGGGESAPEPDASQTPAEAEPDASQRDSQTPAKEEVKEDIGIPPYSPPADFDAAPAGDFPSLCLAALAEATGQAYTTMPARCRRELERCSGRFDAAQVRGMIEFKRDEWRAEDAAKGTRFSRNLTPNTLFSPDHFEQYMGQLLAHREEVGRYAEYD
ncbi:conserved phage C-terminal domain-containing protein [Adlercreutzia muris]|uniref:conserved phage C-terminal domain-containing protein n=1 Tax=Adlercreutzia muris TaxID=1796610 RepID=UPI00351794F3